VNRTSTTRRRFLAQSAGLAATAFLPARAAGQQTYPEPRALIAAPASDKKVAAIVTTYHRYSHADNLVTRFMEGYHVAGKSYPPPCQVASLYIDQVTDIDIGRPLAKQWRVPVVKSPAEALTLGTGKLAVDGVLVVGEHGDYPRNEKGQKLYPRRRFFEEAVKVFRDSKRAVPVFNDKHLSISWTDAKWMYDQSRELGFAFMAGSSVPLAHRRPDLRPENGTDWERALSIGYGHYDDYGSHTLEALQVMTERRKGGETGVKAVQCLEGKEAWEALKAGKWDRSLLDAALARTPILGKGKIEDDDGADALVYLVEYRDGLTAAAYMSPRHVREWAFAGKQKGKADISACWYELVKPQRDHFTWQAHHVGQMMITGKAAYPVERTLITTGMLDFLIQSKVKGHQRIETPELDVKYSS